MNDKVLAMWNSELAEILKKDSKEKIKLFFEFLEMPKTTTKNHQDLVCEKILTVLERYSNGELSAAELLDNLLYTEQYLDMLCFYADREKYIQISISSQRFGDLIKWVGDYPLTNSGSLGFHCENVEDTEQYDVPKRYWALAYWARNTDAHNVINANLKWKIQIVYAILYVMITSTWKYRNEIRKVIAEQTIRKDFDIDAYFRRIVKEYEKGNMQKTFVEMNSVVYNTSRSLSSDSESNEEILSVIELITKKNSDENYCKLIGEAGLGKSRLMRHLEYLDAKARKAIPIYIELRDLVDIADSPIKLLADRMEVGEDICDKILSVVETHLYLDGVNEMLCSDKEKFHICKKLDNLTAAYPKAKILISDRENSAVTVSNNIPTYLLCKLDKHMMNQFIELNCTSEVAQVVHQMVRDNEQMISAVSTPIMLILLIRMVEEGNFDPNATSEKEIFACYVKGLIEREVKEKGETRAKKIEYLLSSLAISDAPTNGEMAYYEEARVLREFKKCADLYGISGIDMLEMIELVTQMGLLKAEKNGDYYTFANKKLEEYFFDYALDKGMIDYE